MADHYTEIPQSDDEDLNSGSGDGVENGISGRGIFPETNFPINVTSQTPDVTCASTYKASITILIVVSVIAALVLVLFALATLRYRFGNKGSYYVAEFKKGKVQKDWTAEGNSADNVFDQPTTKEFML